MFKGFFAGFTNQGPVPASNTIRTGRNEGGKGEIREEITQLRPKKVFCTHITQYLQGKHLVGPTKENTKWTRVRKHKPGTERQQNIWGIHYYRPKKKPTKGGTQNDAPNKQSLGSNVFCLKNLWRNSFMDVDVPAFLLLLKSHHGLQLCPKANSFLKLMKMKPNLFGITITLPGLNRQGYLFCVCFNNPKSFWTGSVWLWSSPG